MSTWFGFAKKTPSTSRRSNQHQHNRNQHLFNDPAINMPNGATDEMYKPTFIPISQPSLPPPNHPIFPPFDPANPLLLLPPLSDTSAIDYWLKLLEDPKFEEQIMPIIWNGRNDHHHHHNRKPFDYDNKFVSNSHPNNGPWIGKKIRKKVKINSRKSEQLRSNLSNKKMYNRGENEEEDDDLEHYEYGPNGDADKWSLQNDIENGSDFDNMMMLTPNFRPHDGQRIKKPRPHANDGFHQVQQQQQQYDTTPRCDKFTEDICIDDFEYPEHAILDEIYKRKDIFQLMYAEVNGDVPLVDGIPKDMDENFSQDYYYSNNDPEDPDDDYHDDFNGPSTDGHHHSTTNKSTSFDFGESNSNNHHNNNNKNSIEQGFVCRSEVLYAKPKLAKNLKRKWRVIVNAGDFTQTIRLEKCNKANSECRYIADHKYASRCAQIHSIHRLLVFEKGKGFFIDSFRLPTACTCHVYSVKQTNPNPSESTMNNNLRTKINTSNSMEPNKSLWSMLSNIDNNPQQSYNDDNNENNNHYENNGAQSSKLYFHSHANQNQMTKQMQQQLQKALNILNNNELFKLLPQLTSIDSQSKNNNWIHNNNNGNVILQKLLENLGTTSSTTGTVPSNFLLTTTSTMPSNNNDNHMSDNKNHINRFTIIPEYQFNLSDMTEGNKVTNDLLTNSENNFGMTNPNKRTNHLSTSFGSISGQSSLAQAPVVQVIHMPVSTNGMTSLDQLDIPATVNRLTQWPYPFDRNDDQHTSTPLSSTQSQSSLSKYLASASNSHLLRQQQKPKFNNDTLASNMTTTALIQINNQTISGSTSIINDKNITKAISNEDSHYSSHNVENDEDDHDDNNSSNDDNTKINFSYHPILDYIVN
nr:probable serine/threonine-protein kinase clkA [Dermatophagoides farinae]